MTEYYDRNYYGPVFGKDKYLKSLFYYKDEVFVRSPYFPRLIIGNFGTVLDERNMWFKLPWTTKLNGDVVVNTRVTLPGREYSKGYCCVDKLVMIAHCPINDYTDKYIIHKDGNPYHNIYAPGTPWHNLEWTDEMHYYKHLRKMESLGIITKYIPPRILNSREYTEQEVDMICKLWEEGKYDYKGIIKVMNDAGIYTDRSAVSNIIYGKPKRWMHIISKYNIDQKRR